MRVNPFSDQNGAKTLPDATAHTYVAYIREYSPPPRGYITIRKVNVNIRVNFLISLITAEVRTIAVLLVILLVNWSGAKTIFVEGF